MPPVLFHLPPASAALVAKQILKGKMQSKWEHRPLCATSGNAPLSISKSDLDSLNRILVLGLVLLPFIPTASWRAESTATQHHSQDLEVAFLD